MVGVGAGGGGAPVKEKNNDVKVFMVTDMASNIDRSTCSPALVSRASRQAATPATAA